MCLKVERDGQNEGGMEGRGGWKCRPPDTYINPWLPSPPGVWSPQLAQRRFSVTGPPNGLTILAWCCQRAITSLQHHSNTDTTSASHEGDFPRPASRELTDILVFVIKIKKKKNVYEWKNQLILQLCCDKNPLGGQSVNTCRRIEILNTLSGSRHGNQQHID